MTESCRRADRRSEATGEYTVAVERVIPARGTCRERHREHTCCTLTAQSRWSVDGTGVTTSITDRSGTVTPSANRHRPAPAHQSLSDSDSMTLQIHSIAESGQSRRHRQSCSEHYQSAITGSACRPGCLPGSLAASARLRTTHAFNGYSWPARAALGAIPHPRS